jgi:hypothetical protein
MARLRFRCHAQPEVVERVGKIHGTLSCLQALDDLAELRESSFRPDWLSTAAKAARIAERPRR